jgi:peptidoglycan hydrolase-like protein with peptidoglycan-binding domain
MAGDRRRRRMPVAAALVVLIASSSVSSGTVERRTLAERLTATGTIAYAGETTVLARLSGTVTALPAVGEVIRRGEPLYAVGAEPVLLMYGSVPAYRTLADGVSGGRDVEQLETNLAALGYEPGTVDEEFTSATAEAVSAWQEGLGLEATGEVELGRVAFLRGPQRVTKLEATLGEALGAAAAGGPALVAWHSEDETVAGNEAASEASQAAVEERRRKLEKRERELAHEREKLEREEERAEEEREREGAGGQGGGAEAGGRGGEASESAPAPEPSSVPVLRTSSTRRVVRVELEAARQAIARRGQEVQVVLPNGAEVPGRVTGLSAVEAATGEGGPAEEGEAAVEATISLTGKGRIPALDGASVSVRFTQRIRKRVLSVPLTALVAIGGERFAVHVLDGGGRRQLVVTPGLAADGYVEIEGRGLKAGMRVETGE